MRNRWRLLMCLILAVSLSGAEPNFDDIREMLCSRNSINLLEAQDELVARGRDLVPAMSKAILEAPSSTGQGISLDGQLNILMALERLADQASAEALEKVAADASAPKEKRHFALLALKSVHGPKTEVCLWGIFDKEKNNEIRGVAVLAAARKGGELTSKRLAELALNPKENPRLRAMAVCSYGTFGRKDGKEVFTHLLKDRGLHPLLQQAVLFAASRTGSASVVPLLLEARHAVVDERRWHALALHRVPSSQSLEPLTSYLKDPDPKVRIFACLSLQHLKQTPQVVMETLRKIANDRQASEDDRADATLALGACSGSYKFLANVVQKSPDTFVRMAAVMALHHLQAPGLEELFVGRITKESNPFVKQRLITCMRDRMPDSLYKTILQYAASGDHNFKRTAAESLCRMRLENGSQRLAHFLKLLASNDARERESAAWCLGLIGDPKAKEALQKAAKDPRRFVAVGAEESLRSLEVSGPTPGLLAHFAWDGTRSPGLYKRHGMYAHFGSSLLNGLLLALAGSSADDAIKEGEMKQVGTKVTLEEWSPEDLGVMASIGLDPSDPRLQGASGTFTHGNWMVWYQRDTKEEAVLEEDKQATYLRELISKKYNVKPYDFLKEKWFDDEEDFSEGTEEPEKYLLPKGEAPVSGDKPKAP